MLEWIGGEFDPEYFNRKKLYLKTLMNVENIYGNNRNNNPHNLTKGQREV